MVEPDYGSAHEVIERALKRNGRYTTGETLSRAERAYLKAHPECRLEVTEHPAEGGQAVRGAFGRLKGWGGVAPAYKSHAIVRDAARSDARHNPNTVIKGRWTLVPGRAWWTEDEAEANRVAARFGGTVDYLHGAFYVTKPGKPFAGHPWLARADAIHGKAPPGSKTCCPWP